MKVFKNKKRSLLKNFHLSKTVRTRKWSVQFSMIFPIGLLRYNLNAQSKESEFPQLSGGQVFRLPVSYKFKLQLTVIS